MANRDFAALKIGGKKQIQPDFAATKFVAVLIIAIFLTKGYRKGVG